MTAESFRRAACDNRPTIPVDGWRRGVETQIHRLVYFRLLPLLNLPMYIPISSAVNILPWPIGWDLCGTMDVSALFAPRWTPEQASGHQRGIPPSTKCTRDGTPTTQPPTSHRQAHDDDPLRISWSPERVSGIAGQRRTDSKLSHVVAPNHGTPPHGAPRLIPRCLLPILAAVKCSTHGHTSGTTTPRGPSRAPQHSRALRRIIHRGHPPKFLSLWLLSAPGSWDIKSLSHPRVQVPSGRAWSPSPIG